MHTQKYKYHPLWPETRGGDDSTQIREKKLCNTALNHMINLQTNPL
uniref:Uncharacterized protein n=1 Tax=Rhizophora mucronata TaxID=61149 RepID=A0A2P2R5B4_RHIMU